MTTSTGKSILLSLLLFSLGCPKNGDQTGAVSGAQGLRLDRQHVIAEWEGGRITYGELYERRKAELRQIQNKQLRDLFQAEKEQLQHVLADILIEAAAKAKGQNKEEYLQSVTGTPTVSAEEVQGFYDQRLKASGIPLEAAKGQIEEFLRDAKKQEMLQGLLERLGNEAGLKLLLPPPVFPFVEFKLAGRPMKGKASAKLTIVEFSDFECPFCSQATPTLEEILKAYPNDVKLYFLHFPLSFHKAAMPAAIAAQCANLQGKFWPMHDQLFQNQTSLTGEKMRSLAEGLGLDMGKFQACREDPATEAYITEDMEQGRQAGVEGTPSFFINGSYFPEGVPTLEAVKAVLED